MLTPFGQTGIYLAKAHDIPIPRIISASLISICANAHDLHPLSRNDA